MLRINNTKTTQIIYTKNQSDFVKLDPGKGVSDDNYNFPNNFEDFPVFQDDAFYDGKIWGVCHTIGGPHLRATLENVKSLVDGFVIYYGGSWSGKVRNDYDVPSIVSEIEFDGNIILKDVSDKNYNQIEQRQKAFEELGVGDWYFIIDDDVAYNEEELEKLKKYMAMPKAVALRVNTKTFWQETKFVGWEERNVLAVRKTIGCKFFTTTKVKYYNDVEYPITNTDVERLHFSYIDSDDNIIAKLNDYRNRPDFKELKPDYEKSIWFKNREFCKEGADVFPLIDRGGRNEMQLYKGVFPEAFKKYSRWGYTKERQLSVIVVTYNSQKVLSNMVDSFIKYRPSFNIEFIMVDNASNDTDYITKEIEKLNNYDIETTVYFNKENVKFTKAVNQALKKSEANFYMLLNPDVIFFEDWFQGLIFQMDNLGVDIIAPKMYEADGSIHFVGGGIKEDGQHFHEHLREKDSDEYDTPKLTKWVTGALMMFSRRLFLALGYLDENYPHYKSDNKYCEKARKHGFKVGYAGKSSKIIHLCGKSSS